MDRFCSVLVALAALALFCAPSARAADDFAGGSRRSGVTPKTAAFAWKHLIPTGAVLTQPAVLSDGSIIAGSSSGRLVSISSSGVRNWDKYTGPVVSSPTVGRDGTLYFGSQDKSLYALTSSGDLKWKFSTGLGIVGQPLITNDDRVIFGSRDGYVYALNSDGVQQWKFTTGGEIRGGAGVLRDGSVVVGSLDGYVYCIDTAGAQKWKWSAGAEVASTPLVQDVSIVVGTRKAAGKSARVVALKMDGTQRWSVDVSGDVDTASIEGAAATVYSTDAAGKLYAIQSDGTLLWRYVAGAALTDPTLCGSNIVFGSENKYVYGVASDGRLLWKYAAGKRVRSQPSCKINGSTTTVYFGSNDHHVYAINIT